MQSMPSSLVECTWTRWRSACSWHSLLWDFYSCVRPPVCRHIGSCSSLSIFYGDRVQKTARIGDPSTFWRSGESKPVPLVEESSLVVRTMPPKGIAMTCEICLEDVLEGEQMRGSPNAECIHEFHLECILHALQRRTICPCCRRDYTEYVLLQEESPSSSSSSFDSSPNADMEQGVAVDPIVEEQVHHQSGVEQVSWNEEASMIP